MLSWVRFEKKPIVKKPIVLYHGDNSNTILTFESNSHIQQ